MSDRYPKSREELEDELAAAKDEIAALKRMVALSEAELRRTEMEVDALLRRKPPHVLDASSSDKFQRPAFSRNRP